MSQSHTPSILFAFYPQLTLLLMHMTGHMLRPSEQRQQQHPKHNLKKKI